MTKETLEYDLTEASKSLVNLAQQICCNTISDNYFYILSEIKNSDENFITQVKRKNLNNSKKHPRRLSEVIPELEKIYLELYDINLYVYKSEFDKTVIDIRYYSKKFLDPLYRTKVEDHKPMLHCKIPHPPSHTEGEKFDINWESKLE